MSDGYVYVINHSGPSYTSPYVVDVARYEDGRRIEVGSEFCQTKRGARRAARRMKEKDQRNRARGTIVVERGEL